MTGEATVYGQDIRVELLGHDVQARVIPGDTPPEGYTLLWEATRWPFKASIAFQNYGVEQDGAAGIVTILLTTPEGTMMFTQSIPVAPLSPWFDLNHAPDLLQRQANRLERRARALVQEAHYYL